MDLLFQTYGNEEEIGVVWDKEENTNKNFKLKRYQRKKINIIE